MIDQAILDKIAKLFALAENAGATVGESANAAAAAQALLEKHKLERADVVGVSLQEEEVNAFGAIVSGQRFSTWESLLAGGVARINSCEIFLSPTFVNGKKEARIVIVGTRQGAQITNYMFTYLHREIDRLTKLALMKNEIQGKTGSNSFRLGAVQEVVKRMTLAKSNEREQATSTALAVVNKEEDRVKAKFEEMTNKPGFKLKTTNSRVNADALEQGREAGRKISLNEGLNGSAGTVKELK